MITMNKTLTFDLAAKEVLNSNTAKGLHWIAKGKLTDNLRKIAGIAGRDAHPKESHSLVDERFAALTALNNQAIAKSRRTKALRKAGELNAKEIKAAVDEEFAESTLVDPDSFAITPLFNHFKIKVTVAPPTRRRLDPVNLYPTVKALIDGLTDARWWIDDDFEHLLEISFVYGGLSGAKDSFKLSMVVEEVTPEELDTYHRVAELRS